MNYNFQQIFERLKTLDESFGKKFQKVNNKINKSSNEINNLRKALHKEQEKVKELEKRISKLIITNNREEEGGIDSLSKQLTNDMESLRLDVKNPQKNPQAHQPNDINTCNNASDTSAEQNEELKTSLQKPQPIQKEHDEKNAKIISKTNESRTKSTLNDINKFPEVIVACKHEGFNYVSKEEFIRNQENVYCRLTLLSNEIKILQEEFIKTPRKRKRRNKNMNAIIENPLEKPENISEININSGNLCKLPNNIELQNNQDALPSYEIIYLKKEMKEFDECSLNDGFTKDAVQENDDVALSESSFDASNISSRVEAISYLDKAHEYLQSFNIAELKNPKEDVTQENDGIKLMNEETSVVPVTERRRDPVLKDKIKWKMKFRKKKKKKPLVVRNNFQSMVFYCGSPGYRIQLQADIDREHGNIYFSVRVLPGVFDEKLKWPCKQRLKIVASHKTNSDETEVWFLPFDMLKNTLERPLNKGDVRSHYIGSFDMKKFLHVNVLKCDIYMV